MKDLIRVVLLVVAIFSGAIAVNSPDTNILIDVLGGVACAAFVLIKDNNKKD